MVVLAGAIAPPLAAGSASDFLESIRRATEAYRDREVAVADGYRPIGGDFPAMGEHWIHIGRLFGGPRDPARPEILTYVTVDGTPRLTGVAYAIPLLPSESPPVWPWAGARWHDHVRTVDEETLLPHAAHGGHGGHGGPSADEPRLAMIHAWAWLANPEGDFAADNWAIPYFRLGLDTPSAAPLCSAKALALVSGGSAHLSAIIEAASGGAPLPRRAVVESLERAERTVRGVLARRSGSVLDQEQLATLAAAWGRLWVDLDRALPAATRRGLVAAR